MSTGSRVLFDSNDTQFLSEVYQKVGIENILRSPVTIDIGTDELALSLEARSAHGSNKIPDFPLVVSWSISLENSLIPSHWADAKRGSYLRSMSVGEVKIGFVTGLETEDPVTEDFLAPLYNIQPPVGGVVERDTFGSGVEGYRDEECHMWGLPRNQSTLTRVLMLAIMYRISGVYIRGGVCVCGSD